MGRNNEKGTKEDLCRYRLEISKADLRFAMLLLEAGEQIETAKELLCQIETYVQGRL